MPYINGTLSGVWAIVDVLVGVSGPRSSLLQKHSFPVPRPVHVRALLDTRASISGFAPRVFRELDLTPVATLGVLTPSTRADAPHDCDVYDVALSLVAGGTAHPFPDTRVMAADCWLPNEGIEALLGMDVLTHGFFQLMGPERLFVFAF